MKPFFVDQLLILKRILSFEARTLWLASSSSRRELLSNRKFVLESLMNDGDVLQFVPREDEEFVHVAVLQNGISLRFCVDADRDNGDLVLSAISKNGLAFQYASQKHRSCSFFATMAIRQNYNAFMFAARHLQKCPSMITLVRQIKECRERQDLIERQSQGRAM
jgi:hypothetical protein